MARHCFEVAALLLTLMVAAGCDAKSAQGGARRVTRRSTPSVATTPSTSLPKQHVSARPADSIRVQQRFRCVDPTPKRAFRSVPKKGPDPACPPDPIRRPALRQGAVIFDAADRRVVVEIAESHEHRMRGLMFRRSLDTEQGMLFVFSKTQIHHFWMKNTCLPLDMLFIDRDGLIVGIEENVPTMNERTYQVACPSLYVLEVNAGWARSHHVVAGDRVRFEGLR